MHNITNNQGKENQNHNELFHKQVRMTIIFFKATKQVISKPQNLWSFLCYFAVMMYH